jgi:thiamine pyrophosphate-dependent acetolactate synthase large subunit-like protein
VCLTVSAPGFLNGLVALANATTNCFPMVQISGSSERHLVDLKQGDYEEMDQLAAAQPFVKAAYRVSRVEDIGRGIARALRTAISGRPGGVYLDIPAAVLGSIIDGEVGAKTLSRLVDPAPRQLPAPEAVDRAVEILAGAERPLVVLGKGAAYAQADDQIREFIESTGIPYVPMSMAKGLLPDDHPQSALARRARPGRASGHLCGHRVVLRRLVCACPVSTTSARHGLYLPATPRPDPLVAGLRDAGGQLTSIPSTSPGSTRSSSSNTPPARFTSSVLLPTRPERG